MTSEERAAYLAAAERLDHVAGKRWQYTSQIASAVEDAIAGLPHESPRRAIAWFLGDWLSYGHIDAEDVAWLIQAAAMKLRAMVEEACLG